MGRRDVIERIVLAAIEGMTPVVIAEQASNDEVMSAYFTILRRGVNVAMQITKDKDATRLALRDTVYTVLADLADSKVN